MWSRCWSSILEKLRQIVHKSKEGQTMEDSKIIQLYWDRDESAIPATSEKYGAYCAAIARNILKNEEDTEECVNDTYLNAWNAMPPQKPSVLSAFLGRITRNLSFNRYKSLHTRKRGGGETPLVLSELGDIVSGKESVEQELVRKELLAEINGFLAGLPKEKRQMFVRRYWFAESIGELAGRFGISEGNTTMTLKRIRLQLKEMLLKKGYQL